MNRETWKALYRAARILRAAPRVYDEYESDSYIDEGDMKECHLFEQITRDWVVKRWHFIPGSNERKLADPEDEVFLYGLVPDEYKPRTIFIGEGSEQLQIQEYCDTDINDSDMRYNLRDLGFWDSGANNLGITRDGRSVITDWGAASLNSLVGAKLRRDRKRRYDRKMRARI